MNPDTGVLVDSVECALGGALNLADASLVIFRHGVLVEFKTTLLAPGLVPTLEGEHRGWQVGPYQGHHCHLDLASVATVRFDVEPVSCQGGRLNYTVWFLAGRDCGNPFRPDGLFAVTLNAPYREDGSARVDVIEAVYALYESLRHVTGVSATAAFTNARPDVTPNFSPTASCEPG